MRTVGSDSLTVVEVTFIEPMLLLRSADLPDRDDWVKALKFDGFRSVGFKTGGKVHVRSRNDKDFNARYPKIVKALSDMPDQTVLDGEISRHGRSCKAVVQRTAELWLLEGSHLFYVFDMMVLAGRDERGTSLTLFSNAAKHGTKSARRSFINIPLAPRSGRNGQAQPHSLP